MEVIDEVRSIISKALKIPVERLTTDARLEDLGAESLDVIEIVYGLEEKFDISIPFKAEEGSRLTKDDSRPAAEETQFATVGDIATMVKQLVEAKTS